LRAKNTSPISARRRSADARGWRARRRCPWREETARGTRCVAHEKRTITYDIQESVSRVARSSTFVPYTSVAPYEYAVVFAFFGDATASTVDPLRPYHATRLSNRPRRLSRRIRVRAIRHRDGRAAEVRGRAHGSRRCLPRGARGAVRESVDLARAGSASRGRGGDVLGYVRCHPGVTAPRLIPRIWRATTERHPVASCHRR
jgi:hypothetical protein